MNRSVKYLFILNPKSFWYRWKQEQVIEKIHKFFGKNAPNDYTIHVSRFPRDAVFFIPLFAKTIPEGMTLRIVAVGGDGILFDCLNGAIGLENIELGAIPYGHTNNFIQGFGRHGISPFKDMKRLFEAGTIPVDVMRCGGNYALGHCVTGLEAEAARYAEKIRQKMEQGSVLLRWLCRRFYTLYYTTGVLAASFDRRLLHQCYRIDIDGKELDGYFWAIPVFNNPRYGGGLRPVTDASPTDGILDLFLIRSRGFLEMCIMFPLYVTGNYRFFPRNILPEKGRKIRISSTEPMIVCMDGVVFFEHEIEIEVLPGKMLFIDSDGEGSRQ